MARLFIRLVLGLLAALMVVLPLVLNKRNYDPALQKAQAVVKQTQDRAREIEQLSSGEATEGGASMAEPSAAAEEVQQLSRDAIAKSSVTPAEAERLRQAMEKLARERRELADQ